MERLSSGEISRRKAAEELGVGEGGNHLPRSTRQLHPKEGVVPNNLVGDQPTPEGPDRAQVAVDSVGGQPPLLRLAERVVGETPFLLQIRDEESYLSDSDPSYIGQESLGVEKPLELAYAVRDNAYGVLTLAFGTGAQPVSGDQLPQLPGGVLFSFC